jgi:hypothetical protein
MSRAILAIVAAPCFLSMWLAIAVAIRLANNSQLRRATGSLDTPESREQQPAPRVPDWDVTIPEWAEEQEPGSER